MYRKIIFFLTLIIININLNARRSEINIPIIQKELKNGLKVYLCDVKYLNAATISIYYNIGSKDENENEKGLSHFLEHMMFKTTKNFKAGEINEIIKSNGGILNAATTFDYTYYYTLIPKNKIEEVLKIEAERMVNLTIDTDEFEAEKKVILEEIGNRSENNPSGFLWTNFIKSVYKKSNYGKPILGSREEVKKHTPEIMKNFYKKYYTPNNAHIIVVGDIDIDETYNLIKKYFENIEKKEIKKPEWIEEPEQEREQRFVFKKQVQLPQAIIYYHGPNALHLDSSALELIEFMLFDGRSSKLVQKLVIETGLALQVSGGLYLMVHKAPFSINFIARDKKYLPLIEKMIYEEIEKFKRGEISEWEIEKAKNKFYKEHISSFKKITNIANLIGNGAILGDYLFFFNTRTKRILDITREHLQRVANKYFTEKNRSVGFLIPE